MGAEREHGTRAKYVVERCRCEDCTAANTAYYHQTKRRVAPTTVGAARARRYLRELSAQGVGYKTVADAAGLGRSTVFKILKGEVVWIKPDTERAILGVTAANIADGAYVDAGPTWEIINRLLALGWTKAAINRAMGNEGRALQLSRHRILAVNARAIAALWDKHGHREPPKEAKTPPEPPPFWEGETDWMKRGACRNDDVPTWLFFAGRGDTRTVEAAKTVCAGCGVQDDCLQYALRNNAVGIWGGTSGADRRGMKPRSTKCRDCGVEVPWKRQNQQRCDDCYRVHRSQQQQRWHHEVGKFRQEASA